MSSKLLPHGYIINSLGKWRIVWHRKFVAGESGPTSTFGYGEPEYRRPDVVFMLIHRENTKKAKNINFRKTDRTTTISVENCK